MTDKLTFRQQLEQLGEPNVRGRLAIGGAGFSPAEAVLAHEWLLELDSNRESAKEAARTLEAI